MYYSVMALLEKPYFNLFFIPAAGTLKGTSDNRVVENITSQRLSKQRSPLNHYQDFLFFFFYQEITAAETFVFYYVRFMWTDHRVL